MKGLKSRLKLNLVSEITVQKYYRIPSKKSTTCESFKGLLSCEVLNVFVLERTEKVQCFIKYYVKKVKRQCEMKKKLGVCA